MLKILRPAIGVFVFLTLVTGLLYPLVITGLAQALFPYQANGSVIMQNGKPVGSELIGQGFDGDPRYIWGRPSVLVPEYAAVNSDLGTGSAASNYGPLNPALVASGQEKDANGTPIPEGTIKTRIDALNAANQAAGVTVTALLPADLVTASYSGLDPDISPAAADYQVPRVAKLRGLSEDVVRQLVSQYTTGRTLGLLGEPRVNVLKLNLALDAAPGQIAPTPTAVSTAAATELATPAATDAATPAATAAK